MGSGEVPGLKRWARFVFWARFWCYYDHNRAQDDEARPLWWSVAPAGGPAVVRAGRCGAGGRAIRRRKAGDPATGRSGDRATRADRALDRLAEAYRGGRGGPPGPGWSPRWARAGPRRPGRYPQSSASSWYSFCRASLRIAVARSIRASSAAIATCRAAICSWTIVSLST